MINEFEVREVAGVKLKEGYITATEGEAYVTIAIETTSLRAVSMAINPHEARKLARQLYRAARRIDARVEG